jgi:hypothetical protein
LRFRTDVLRANSATAHRQRGRPRLGATAAALLVLTSIASCAWAQEWTSDELAKPRLYFGLSRGALPSQERDLRSFIALQKVARDIVADLKQTAKSIAIGDHSGDRDEWEPLARRGYTHYVIAVPQEPEFGSVDVTWFAGQIGSDGKRVLSAELHRSIRIKNPTGESAEIVDVGSNNPVTVKEAATSLAQSLRVLFPEIRAKHKFAIRCINAVPDTISTRFDLMSYLSRNLVNPPWDSAGRFSADAARNRCQNKSEERSDADLMIGGWLTQRTQQSKNLIQTTIEIDDLLSEQRAEHARIYEEVRGRRYPQSLDDFCVEHRINDLGTMKSLATYIQAHGLKIENIQYVHEFRCK